MTELQRLEQLEEQVAVLSDHNQTHVKNIHELHAAVSTGLPLALETQEAAVRVLHEHITGLHQIIDELIGRLGRLEALLGTIKIGPPN